MFYVIIDYKDFNNLTDSKIQKYAEQYGVFTDKRKAFDELVRIEDENNLNYNALTIIGVR